MFMEVNSKELLKQREESIIKNGKYCQVKVLVGVNDKKPVSNIEVKKVSPIEVAILISTLRETIVSIAKRNPFAYELSKRMIADMTEIEIL